MSEHNTIDPGVTESRRVRRRVMPRLDLVGWGVLATILVGAAIRFSVVTWGLPTPLHTDEWVIIQHAIELAQRNSFEPSYFARPDHLEIQLSYIAYVIWAHLAHGVTPETLYAIDPAPFYAISRAITAAFGSAMIVVAYLIGREFSRPIGLSMAIAFAFFPPFVEHSRYATPDVPLTFTAMIVVYGCLRYLRAPQWRWLTLASLGVALGVTVKYPAAVGCLVIALVVIVDAIRSRALIRIVTRGLSAIGIVIGGTFLISPVLFTNFAAVRHELSAQNTDGHLGASGLGWAGNLGFYVRDFAAEGGVVLLLLAVAGGIWAVARKQWLALPLLLGLVYWVVISALSLHWPRWGLPMYTVVLMFAAFGVHACLRLAGILRFARPARAAVAAVVAVTGLGLVAGAANETALATAEDTRIVAGAQLPELGVVPENTIADGYTPFLLTYRATIADSLELVDGRLEPTSTENGDAPEYVLVSNYMAGRYLASDGYEHERAIYQAVMDDLRLVEQWPALGNPPSGEWALPRIIETFPFIASIVDGGMTGANIWLYELDPGAADDD